MNALRAQLAQLAFASARNAGEIGLIAARQLIAVGELLQPPAEPVDVDPDPERKASLPRTVIGDGMLPWPARRPACFDPAAVRVGPDPEEV